MNNSWKNNLRGIIVSTLAVSTNVCRLRVVSVQPVQSSVAEETFQTLIVNRALEELGYDVKSTQSGLQRKSYTSIAKVTLAF